MIRSVLTAAAAAAGLSSVAAADSFTIAYQGTTSGTAVNANFTGTGVYSAGLTGAGNGGQFTFVKSGGGGTHHAYCIQIGDQGFSGNYSSVALDFAPEPANNAPQNPVPMGSWKARVLRALTGKNLDMFATISTAAEKSKARAFQLAVWEVVYTGMSGVTNTTQLLAWAQGLVANSTTYNAANDNLTFGAQAANLTAMNSLFNSLTVADLDGNGAGYAWTSATGQDVLVIPVPAPALLAGVGLIGVVALRRRSAKA